MDVESVGGETGRIAGSHVADRDDLELLACIALDEAVARLALGPFVNAHHAPGDVIVDRRALAGQPDQRTDAEAPVLGYVHRVLHVAGGTRNPGLLGQPTAGAV